MWYPLLCEIIVTNLFQGWRLADMIKNFTKAVFDQSGSTFDNTSTVFNAFVTVPLVIYDMVSHFTEANNISSSTNFGKYHMFFAISPYIFDFIHFLRYILSFTSEISFRYCCSSPECRDHLLSLQTTHIF